MASGHTGAEAAEAGAAVEEATPWIGVEATFTFADDGEEQEQGPGGSVETDGGVEGEAAAAAAAAAGGGGGAAAAAGGGGGAEKTLHSFRSPPPVEGKERQEVAGGEGSRFSFQYTGVHDDGKLPELKSGGVFGGLIQAVLEAKDDANVFLSKIIDAQRAKEGAGRSNCSKPNGEAKAKQHQHQKQQQPGQKRLSRREKRKIRRESEQEKLSPGQTGEGGVEGMDVCESPKGEEEGASEETAGGELHVGKKPKGGA